MLGALTALALAKVWEGHVTVATAPSCAYSEHRLWFRVCRPELLRERNVAPLVVVHGGPQVPSDYLFDLEKVDDRPVIFYDQLGCGRSSAPSQDLGDVYSVASSLRDLRGVLQALRLPRYHLYGQSWGGMLAAMHAARADGSCRSLVLSNSPASVALVEAEAARLLVACGGDVATFMATHNLRIAPQPQRLEDAYSRAGDTWRGSGAIAGVEVSAAAMRRVRCPALSLRGQHDFCTDACVEPWRGLRDVRFETLDDASHHALLEQPARYLELLGTFLREHDSS